MLHRENRPTNVTCKAHSQPFIPTATQQRCMHYKCPKEHPVRKKKMHCLIVWCVGSFLSVAAQHRWQPTRPSYMYAICRKHAFQKDNVYTTTQHEEWQHSLHANCTQSRPQHTPIHSINQASSRHDPLWPCTNHLATATIVPRAHQHTDSCSQNTATPYPVIE